MLAGRYRLEERIQTGPDGSFWRAVDGTLDRAVTVQVLRPGHPYTDEVVDAARRAALVEDPRLLRVLDVGQEAGVTYIVAERVTGRSLAELLPAGPLPAESVRRIVGEAAQALDRAGRRGLHHMRLTPRSLLVSADGSVKVLGTAVDAAAAGVEYDTARAAGHVDAVGLVSILYAALTSRWPGSLDTGLPRAPRVAGRAVPPGDLVAGVPNDLDTLCAVTLGPQDDGPTSPGELAEQLAPWARAEPLTDPRGLALAGPVRPASGGPGLPTLLPVEPAVVPTPVPTTPAPIAPAAGVPTTTAPAPAARDASGSSSVRRGFRRSGGGLRPAPFTDPPAGPLPSEPLDPPGSGRPSVPERGPAHPVPTDPDPTEPVPREPVPASSAPSEPVRADAVAAAPGTAGHTTQLLDPVEEVPGDPSRTTAERSAPRRYMRRGGGEGGHEGPQRPRQEPSRTESYRAEAGSRTEPPRPETYRPETYRPETHPQEAYRSEAYRREGHRQEASGGGDWASWDGVGTPVPDEEPVGPFLPPVPLDRPTRDQSRVVIVVLVGLVLLGAVLAVANLLDFDPRPLTGPPSRPSPSATSPARPTPSPSAPAAAPTAPAAAARPEIDAVRALDPGGDGDENGGSASRAVDGDTSTAWRSERYDSQDFGGIKDGVGLVVDLGRRSRVAQVRLRAPGEDGEVQLRSSPRAGLRGSKVLDDARVEGGTITLEPSSPVATRYLVLWFTRVPRSDDGTNRIYVTEVDVR